MLVPVSTGCVLGDTVLGQRTFTVPEFCLQWDVCIVAGLLIIINFVKPTTWGGSVRQAWHVVRGYSCMDTPIWHVQNLACHL